jgi:hypothetical protein
VRVLIGNLGCRIESEISVAHLGEWIQFRVRIIFPCHQGEVRFGRAVFLDINLCDAPEQLREHKIAVLRLFIVIVGSRAEDVRTIERRHRFLLFRANDEHDVMKPADDPFRA